MPEFQEDPSVLTKDKLKSELLAHNVELPSGNPNKDVLVQLYLNNLTVRNKNHPNLTVDGFSSDEELPPPVLSGRSRSSGKKSSRNSEKIELDVTALTDEGLRDELQEHGVVVGPIVASTRKLYEKKLQKLLGAGPAPPPQVTHNGNSESAVYSDEDEVTPEPEAEPETEAEPEPAPAVERSLRSRGKNSPIIISQQQTVEKISARDQSSKVEEKDVLKDLFPNDVNGPTGFSVTSRCSIKGAAKRLVTPSDQGTNENHLLPPKSTTTISSPHAESHIVHRVSSPPPSSSSFSSILPPSVACPPSRLSGAAPPAGQSRAVRCGWSLWMKLALLGFVAAFLFLVYQTMEPSSSGALGK